MPHRRDVSPLATRAHPIEGYYLNRRPLTDKRVSDVNVRVWAIAVGQQADPAHRAGSKFSRASSGAVPSSTVPLLLLLACSRGSGRWHR